MLIGGDAGDLIAGRGSNGVMIGGAGGTDGQTGVTGADQLGDGHGAGPLGGGAGSNTFVVALMMGHEVDTAADFETEGDLLLVPNLNDTVTIDVEGSRLALGDERTLFLVDIADPKTITDDIALIA